MLRNLPVVEQKYAIDNILSNLKIYILYILLAVYFLHVFVLEYSIKNQLIVLC